LKKEDSKLTFCRKSQLAFTLAELLISLLILGVIATFTIPKILSASQNNQKNAIFKESISTLAGALDMGLKTGDLDPITNGDTYFLTHINAVTVCNSNSSTQGCWNTTIQGTPSSEYNEPGLILHNGAYVVCQYQQSFPGTFN
jgi:prepilin-type N-terminal cleavage/methylation domain-containing protein